MLFAKLRFRGKAIVFALFMSAMIIPGEVTLVPNYLLMNYFGWLNSYKALVIPSMLSVFGIFLLRQFFAEIPDEILEAAKIDGASMTRTFSSIVLPAAVPPMITLALMTFLGNWDSYLWPLIVINDEKETDDPGSHCHVLLGGRNRLVQDSCRKHHFHGSDPDPVSVPAALLHSGHYDVGCERVMKGKGITMKYDTVALGELLIDFTPAGLSPAGQ
ncbi:carbohydrate ABC transporter permease [Paenibacillus rhizoplanae]